MMEKVAVALERVPETLLWTLYHRAVEARRPDAVLHDPMAVELVDRIDFPFRERFGTGEDFSQWQALRARCFDDALRRFIAAHPTGTVVALGAGLETQFWRVDDGSVRWLTVDLPKVIGLRQRLLPKSDRLRTVGTSALDPSWMDEVDDYAGVLITAQGLLMYLEPEEGAGCRTLPSCGRPASRVVEVWCTDGCCRSRASHLCSGGCSSRCWRLVSPSHPSRRRERMTPKAMRQAMKMAIRITPMWLMCMSALL
jgi:O-methyltransferase involved in polyketide biosynthesis